MHISFLYASQTKLLLGSCHTNASGWHDGRDNRRGCWGTLIGKIWLEYCGMICRYINHFSECKRSDLLEYRWNTWIIYRGIPRSEKVDWGGGIGMENLDVHYGSSPSDTQTVPMVCARVCRIFVPARISSLRRGRLLPSIRRRFTGFPAWLWWWWWWSAFYVLGAGLGSCVRRVWERLSARRACTSCVICYVGGELCEWEMQGHERLGVCLLLLLDLL